MEWAGLVVTILGLYAAVGVLFAGWFVLFGVRKVDAAATGGPWGFRVLIFPGSAALWPVLLGKLWSRSKTPKGAA